MTLFLYRFDITQVPCTDTCIDYTTLRIRFESCDNCISTLPLQVVKRCNDGAKKMQQTEQMYHIAKTIEFPSTKVCVQSLMHSNLYTVSI